MKHKQNEAVKEFISGRRLCESPHGFWQVFMLCCATCCCHKSPLHTTLQQIFEADGAVLFLAHSHGCLYVRTSHTQSHTQNYVLCQNSTIIVKQKPVQSHQTLLPPSPFTPPTNRHAKGLGDARLVGTIHTPVFWYSCCWDPCFWVELDHVELILALTLTLTSSLHTSM